MIPEDQEPHSGDPDVMEGRVAKELKDTTFQVDMIAEGAILHTDPNTVRAVLSLLSD